MKNSADQGGCYPPAQRPKAEVDNTLRVLQNSSYPTKAEFNNCFIVHSKYFPILRSFAILLFVVSSLPTLGVSNFTYSTNLPLRVLSQEDPENKVATPPLECSVAHLLLCCVT